MPDSRKMTKKEIAKFWGFKSVEQLTKWVKREWPSYARNFNELHEHLLLNPGGRPFKCEDYDDRQWNRRS